MNHPLFTEIEKFNQWAKDYSDIAQDSRDGEWECDYHDWTKIIDTFENFLKATTVSQITETEKAKLIYIIARDNECEILAEKLSGYEDIFLSLVDFSIKHGKREDKWQFAVQLSNLKDKNLAREKLEVFVNDEDEYVNRRALVELARLQSDKTEYYCEKFWYRGKYGEMEEYQRIAVLHALAAVKSNQLKKYLDLAKQDGRKYLVDNALELSKTLA